MARVAFLGTGIMGAPMALRLAASGTDVIAWNRTAAKVAAIARHGVCAAATPSQAVEGADAVVVMLADADSIDAVLFGRDPTDRAPADVLRSGALVVTTSSIPVAAAREHAARLATRGVRYVDAPVSGGERGARDGTLTIMAGGDATDVAEAAALLAPCGRTTRIGPTGTGQLTKLANQIVVAGTLLAVAEGFAFARAGGADLAAVRAALAGGFSDSTVLRQHGERIVNADYAPGSPSMQQRENLRNAAGQARAMGVELTLLPVVERAFESMVAAGRGALDIAAVFEQVVERAHGAKGAA
jgi:2-hydroxy-3-oxopropionate reductase